MKLAMPFAPGTRTTVTQRFGVNPAAYARFPSLPYHNGFDIAFPRGTPVLAMANDGQVVRSGWDPGGYGLWCEVQHPGFAIRLAHGIRNGIAPVVGLEVNAGDVLFEGDSSGNSSGDHTHGEIRTRNAALADGVMSYFSPHGRYVIDPFPYLPAPFGSGRDIGGDSVPDEITKAENALVAMTTSRDVNEARKNQLLTEMQTEVQALARTQYDDADAMRAGIQRMEQWMADKFAEGVSG